MSSPSPEEQKQKQEEEEEEEVLKLIKSLINSEFGSSDFLELVAKIYAVIGDPLKTTAAVSPSLQTETLRHILRLLKNLVTNRGTPFRHCLQ